MSRRASRSMWRGRVAPDSRAPVGARRVRPSRADRDHCFARHARPGPRRHSVSQVARVRSPRQEHDDSRIPVTGIARTVLDVCAVVDDDVRALAALDDVRRRHLASWDELWRCLVLHARRGRNGIVRYRRVLERRWGRPVPHGRFARLADSLFADAGLPRMAPTWIVLPGHRYRVDLAYPELKIAIELDGRGHELLFDEDPVRAQSARGRRMARPAVHVASDDRRPRGHGRRRVGRTPPAPVLAFRRGFPTRRVGDPRNLGEIWSVGGSADGCHGESCVRTSCFRPREAVRKRLDFDAARPVELVRECSRVATQRPDRVQPAGLALDGRDRRRQAQALGEIYPGVALYRNMPTPRARSRPAAPTATRPQQRVASSAEYLAEHMGEAPVLVIPCIEGRIDTMPGWISGSFWGSLSRGVELLPRRPRPRPRYVVDDACTSCTSRRRPRCSASRTSRSARSALIPVAYTKGTDFKPGPRIDLDAIFHVDSW